MGEEEDGSRKFALHRVASDRTLHHSAAITLDAARRSQEGSDEMEGLVPIACRSEGGLMVDADGNMRMWR